MAAHSRCTFALPWSALGPPSQKSRNLRRGGQIAAQSEWQGVSYTFSPRVLLGVVVGSGVYLQRDAGADWLLGTRMSFTFYFQPLSIKVSTTQSAVSPLPSSSRPLRPLAAIGRPRSRRAACPLPALPILVARRGRGRGGRREKPALKNILLQRQETFPLDSLLRGGWVFVLGGGLL